jgi:GNAT superfamily N-acetyltransferase
VTTVSLQPGVEIRRLAARDVDAIAAAFASWPKPRSQFQRYLAEQGDERRVVLVAWCETQVCGYAVVVWQPDYAPFGERGIPEIQDLNVLPPFRRRGIGSRLLDAAEEVVASRSPEVGIGFGLYADYGAAQRLYVRRGYVPDGRGASHRGRFVLGGELVVADDDLAIYLTKRLLG